MVIALEADKRAKPGHSTRRPSTNLVQGSSHCNVDTKIVLVAQGGHSTRRTANGVRLESYGYRVR